MSDEGRTKRQTRFHGRMEADGRRCWAPGCTEPGEFRAPPLDVSSPGDGPPQFRWMCLDHVRAFNAGYNFFDGMTVDEIHRAQRPYAGWERETRAFSGMGDRGPRWQDFADPLDAIAAKYREQPHAANGKRLSDEDMASLKVLGLASDADRMGLRKRYSELVRKFHPDRNGGDRSHEERLTRVIAAYQHLKRAPAFV